MKSGISKLLLTFETDKERRLFIEVCGATHSVTKAALDGSAFDTEEDYQELKRMLKKIW